MLYSLLDKGYAMTIKPFSQACEENQQPILQVLKPLFRHSHEVLEIGSGTGQHAVYFAKHMPHLIWHTSDKAENHEGIRLWLNEADLANTRAPFALDVLEDRWPTFAVDAVFSANTTHIMHWKEVEAFFNGVGQVLPKGGLFALYGPFNYNGQFTSDSNARFDRWLKGRDPQSGIRDFADVNWLAEQAGLKLLEDNTMPVNNRLLVWQKL